MPKESLKASSASRRLAAGVDAARLRMSQWETGFSHHETAVLRLSLARWDAHTRVRRAIGRCPLSSAHRQHAAA